MIFISIFFFKHFQIILKLKIKPKLYREIHPYTFSYKENIEAWIEEQRGYFYDRENDFKREILGEWLEQSEFNIFKKWEVIDNPNLKANLWVIIYELWEPFSLGIYLKEDTLVITKELFSLPTEKKSEEDCFLLTIEENFKFFEKEGYLARIANFYSPLSLKSVINHRKD